MSETNKALVRRYYAEAMGNFAGIDQVVSADLRGSPLHARLAPWSGGGAPVFPEDPRQHLQRHEIEFDFMLAEGDKVDCHFALVAKHTGEFAGIKPKGNLIRCPAISTFRVEDGKLVEAWEIFDSGNLLQQMRA